VKYPERNARLLLEKIKYSWKEFQLSRRKYLTSSRRGKATNRAKARSSKFVMARFIRATQFFRGKWVARMKRAMAS
jgi:hypothetical protein